jgi:hypothetical protein
VKQDSLRQGSTKHIRHAPNNGVSRIATRLPT